MSTSPEIRYADNDGVSIAYTRWGSGEPGLYLPSFVGNVELVWDIDEGRRALERAGSCADCIMVDRRGTGLSDRTGRPSTLEDRIADCLAVLDAEQIQSAHLWGFSGGAPIALAMASRHPDRVRSVVAYGGPVAGVPWEEIEPYVEPGDPPVIPDAIDDIIANWGTAPAEVLKWFAPDAVGDPRIEAWHARFQRQSASPGALRAHVASVIDISADLDRVTCPLMFGHCRFDPLVPVAHTRYLASRFPDAEVRIWDSRNHVIEYDQNWAEYQADALELCFGKRPDPVTKSRFAAVLFTDIVDSTPQTAARGDRSWAKTVSAHDSIADLVIDAHGGRRVKSTGDGLLAVFTDPAETLRAAVRLRDQLADLGITIRAGVHAGQVQEIADGDVIGIAVVIASRVESASEAGQIAVTSTVADLVMGDPFRFQSMGQRKLKGLDRDIEILHLED